MVEYILINPYDKTIHPSLYGWNGPGWYFWDETEAHCYGPFETAEEANKKLKEYAETL